MKRLRELARFTAFLPTFVRQWWRAMNARDRENWLGVADSLFVIHDSGFATDDSHFWRACACLHLDRDEEALAELERISGVLGSPAEEASRYINQALALWRLGRIEDARSLILERLDSSWPPDTYEKARTLLVQAGTAIH